MTVKPAPDNAMIVYSSFRASSTWFWSRLRAIPKLYCYYEVTNEFLGRATSDNLLDMNSDGWTSKHPKGLHYYTEYEPLLRTGGGVHYFPHPALRFMEPQGLDADVNPEIIIYFENLITFARKQDRLPVLTCTRTLGRVAGVSRAVSGLHVLLIRNIFHQWNSYAGQYRRGKPWFIERVRATITENTQDPFFNFLASEILGDHRDNDTDGYDALFIAFVGLRIYLSVAARRHCNLVVDTYRMVRDAENRKAVEQSLSDFAGAPVDLSDVRDEIEAPAWLIANPDFARIMSIPVVDRALEYLVASDEEREWAARLIDDLWHEYRQFSLYANAAMEAYLQERTSRLEIVAGLDTILTEAKRKK